MNETKNMILTYHLTKEELKNPDKIANFIHNLGGYGINSVVFHTFEKVFLNNEIDASVLFDTSLRRTITELWYDPELWALFITTDDCEDNTTNLTAEVIEETLNVVEHITMRGINRTKDYGYGT